MSPSSTNNTSGSNRTDGKRARKASAHCQCAVARRPSSTPASARVKAPLQKPTRRAPLACARRTASRTAGRRGTSTSGRLGTIRVSAVSAASSGATPVSVKNPSRISVLGSGEQSAKS
nr:hypothetical protein GCM10020241_66090 [Streptoalloteichus tenebrarius]